MHADAFVISIMFEKIYNETVYVVISCLLFSVKWSDTLQASANYCQLSATLSVVIFTIKIERKKTGKYPAFTWRMHIKQ